MSKKRPAVDGHGTDPNASDLAGDAALHFAARGFRCDVAKALPDAGAWVDPVNLHGNTRLPGAVFESRGRGEMIRLLLARGADRSRRNRHGVPPVECANNIANFDVRQHFA